jgi:hypothetical protein
MWTDRVSKEKKKKESNCQVLIEGKLDEIDARFEHSSQKCF